MPATFTDGGTGSAASALQLRIKSGPLRSGLALSGNTQSDTVLTGAVAAYPSSGVLRYYVTAMDQAGHESVHQLEIVIQVRPQGTFSTIRCEGFLLQVRCPTDACGE
ncbi:hypothetical protein EON66_03930 [archaeon]|nr:MAG: hypothetical protein EON66_03930 [archaeon]